MGSAHCTITTHDDSPAQILSQPTFIRWGTTQRCLWIQQDTPCPICHKNTHIWRSHHPHIVGPTWIVFLVCWNLQGTLPLILVLCPLHKFLLHYWYIWIISPSYTHAGPVIGWCSNPISKQAHPCSQKPFYGSSVSSPLHWPLNIITNIGWGLQPSHKSKKYTTNPADSTSTPTPTVQTSEGDTHA